MIEAVIFDMDGLMFDTYTVTRREKSATKKENTH